MPKILSEQASDALESAKQALLAGGVLVVPTETVYGLVTLWSNVDGRNRIYELKRRPREKRLQMLAGGLESAAPWLREADKLSALARRFWPGPLTLVVPAADGLDTIGLRIPRCRFLLELLKLLPEPLAATSANLSGYPPPQEAMTAAANLAGEPDMVIDGGVCSETDNSASTVISLLGTEPQLLRAGQISLEDVRAVWAEGSKQ
jgi:L-threonylcarbamoyladenylate synthase